MTYKKILSPVLLAAALSVFFPVAAFASTGLTIQPVKIDETLNAGQTLTGQILLQNASDGPVNVEVSVQDFVPNAGADSIQFVGRAPGLSTVRDWIKIESKPTFLMPVGAQMEIPYTITAPANAEPGGHFGVALFKATPAGATSTGSLKVGTQVGMIILVAIPGSHLEKGNILSFTAPAFLQHGPVPFGINFQNTGTVHFEPKGSIVVTNMLNQKVAEIPVTGQVVLPTSIKQLNFEWDSSGFSIGRFTAVASIKDGEGDVLTSQTVHFWIIPIWYTLAFIIGLIVIYMLLRYIKRHVRLSVVQ